MEFIGDLPADYEDLLGDTIDLRYVPDPATRPTDPEAPAKAAAWRLWAEGINLYRTETLARCQDDPQQQALEYARCAADPAYFLATFGWIFEPRASSGEGDKPWTPFGLQVRMLRWLDEVMVGTGAKADGLVSKSRDMGASWTCCAYAVHGFLFKEPFVVKLISRAEALVDDNNNPDSLFWKILYFLQNLPHWLLPEGFSIAEHRSKLKITHPSKRCVIAGEATTSKSGRGGRSTIAIVDEAAYVDDLRSVHASMGPTTKHRVLVSSESIEHGDFFYRLRMAKEPGRMNVLELDWWLHPEHSRAWYEQEKERYWEDPEGFAGEYDRDPHAAAGSTFIYPISREYTVGEFPYEVGMPMYVGFDPGFDDEAAINWVGFDHRSGRYRLIESYARSQQEPEYYASLFMGMLETGAEGFDYNPHGLYDPLDILAFTRQIHGGVSYFGDPNGKERRTGHHDSWYDRILLWSQAHSPTKRGIVFEVGWDNDQRSFQGRRASLRRILPRLDFNDTPGVSRVLRALQEHRFERPKSPLQAERKQPHHHGEESHVVAALEYWAVNVERLDAQSGFDNRPIDSRGNRLGKAA